MKRGVRSVPLAREASYLTCYFKRTLSESGPDLVALVRELVQICPGLSLFHAGSMPPQGRFKRLKRDGVDSVLDHLVRVDSSDDAQVSLHLKTEPNDTFVGDYHIVLWAKNWVFNREYKVWKPNLVQLYFPSDRLDIADTAIAWLEKAARLLDVCYAFVNPVVMFDEYHLAESNTPALELLERNAVLDLFDDMNHDREFADHVKGPMWFNLVSEGHVDRLGPEALRQAERLFLVRSLGEGRWTLKLSEAFGGTAEAERLDDYRALGRLLEPIRLREYRPVAFRFSAAAMGFDGTHWVSRFA